MATDTAMINIVKTGKFITNGLRDYTVKVDVRNLDPDQVYYYQFEAFGRKSLIGRTKTAPKNNTSRARFAVVSCSNYQSGYFNAYRDLAKQKDLDAIIHLGDYVYEYATGQFGYSDEIGRTHKPDNEVLSLDDYQLRYSYYRLDPDLRAIHQQHPFITIWDDHEFANDAYTGGAENHSGDEGSWEERKNNAYKAYFDWMPIRENGDERNRIYRSIKYGDLVDVLMLDTRMDGREKQPLSLFGILGRKPGDTDENGDLSETDIELIKTQIQKANADASLEDVLKFRAEIKENTRLSLLNHLRISDKETENSITKEQLESILDYQLRKFDENLGIKNSLPTDSIEHHRVNNLIAKSVIKDQEEPVKEIGDEKRSSKYFLGLPGLLNGKKMVSDKQMDWLLDNLSNSSSQWKLLGNQVMFTHIMGNLFLNLDPWDGYPKQRDQIIDYIHDAGIKNVVIATGDIHSTWVSDIPHNFIGYHPLLGINNSVATEFVVPSITSDNADEFVGSKFITDLATGLLFITNPHIKKIELTQNGFMIMDFNRERLKTVWSYVGIKSPNESASKPVFAYRVNSGESFVRRDNTFLNSLNYGPLAPLEVQQDKVASSREALLVGMYPNPAVNKKTFLHFVLKNDANIKVSLHNSLGSKVKTYINAEKFTKGTYRVEIDLNGIDVNGVYNLIIDFGTDVYVRRLILR